MDVLVDLYQEKPRLQARRQDQVPAGSARTGEGSDT